MSTTEPVNIMELPDKPAPKERPLTRAQRRFKERVETEARETHALLAEKFLDFFTTSDNPEGQEVIAKIHQLSTQWKVYCNRKALNTDAQYAMERYCEGVLQQYLAVKEAKTTE